MPQPAAARVRVPKSNRYHLLREGFRSGRAGGDLGSTSTASDNGAWRCHRVSLPHTLVSAGRGDGLSLLLRDEGGAVGLHSRSCAHPDPGNPGPAPLRALVFAWRQGFDAVLCVWPPWSSSQ